MDVIDIVKEYVKNNGFDGLYNCNLECGCVLDDFCNCGDLRMECEAVYRHESAETCPPDCDMDCFSNKNFDVYNCDKKSINKEESNA
jgi:hypothetical protein